MAIEVLSLFVADQIRAEDNGKMLVIGAYGVVHLDEAPPPADITVLAILTGAPKGEHLVEVEAIDYLGEQTLKTSPEVFESEGERVASQIQIHLEQFQFPSSGPYMFNLLVDGEKVGRVPVSMSFPIEEAAEEEQSAGPDAK